MAGAFVRENGAGKGDAHSVSVFITSKALAIGTNATAGNTVMLIICLGSTDAIGTYTISDSNGNSWTKDHSIVDATDTALTWIVASTRQNVGALTTADTITISTSGGGWDVYTYWIEEFSGLLTVAGYVDRTANNHGPAATSGSTGTTSATRHVDEVAIAAMGIPNTGTNLAKAAAYTAFTTGVQVQTDTVSLNSISAFPTYKILSGLATQSETYTFLSNTFAGLILTYQAKVTTVNPTGIASGQVVSTADRLTRILQNGLTIPSGEAFGLTDLMFVLAEAGISSSEAFGQTDSLAFGLSPTGVGSGENWGQLSAIVRYLQETGIPSAETFGITAVAGGAPLAPPGYGVEVGVSELELYPLSISDMALAVAALSEVLLQPESVALSAVALADVALSEVLLSEDALSEGI